MQTTTLHLPGLRVDATAGLMHGVSQVGSPNFDARPQNAAPELIVVHGISLPPGGFGGPWIDRLFTNSLPPEEHPFFAEVADARVSAHLLIRRGGEITQYVQVHGSRLARRKVVFSRPRGLQRFFDRHRARGHRFDAVRG